MKIPVLIRKQVQLITIIMVTSLIICGGCHSKAQSDAQYRVAAPPAPTPIYEGQVRHVDRPDNVRIDSLDQGMHFTGGAQETSLREKSELRYRHGQTADRAYFVGSGDMLEVKVFQLMDLERESVLITEVDENGQIYLPLLTHVTVEGMTAKEIRDELVRRYSQDYIRDPKVDVNIKKYNSKMIMVLGYVSQPGPMALQTNSTTLLDVISRSGGITPEASPDIEILRGAYNIVSQPGRKAYMAVDSIGYERELVPVSRLFAEEGQGQINPVIYPGDVVKVKAASDGYVYIAGEVEQPGSKAFRRPLTILQAVTCAGGTTRIAKEKECRIIRRLSDGSEKEIVVNLEDIREGKQTNLLMAQNDTVIIPVHPVKKFFNDLNRMIGRGFQTGVSATYNASQDMGIPSGGGGYYTNGGY